VILVEVSGIINGHNVQKVFIWPPSDQEVLISVIQALKASAMHGVDYQKIRSTNLVGFFKSKIVTPRTYHGNKTTGCIVIDRGITSSV
jgi:hypothetical protein